MASEEEWECTNDASETHNHRNYAAHHHTETTSLGANKEPTATKGERKKTESPVFPCPLKDGHRIRYSSATYCEYFLEEKT